MKFVSGITAASSNLKLEKDLLSENNVLVTQMGLASVST